MLSLSAMRAAHLAAAITRDCDLEVHATIGLLIDAALDLRIANTRAAAARQRWAVADELGLPEADAKLAAIAEADSLVLRCRTDYDHALAKVKP